MAFSGPQSAFSSCRAANLHAGEATGERAPQDFPLQPEQSSNSVTFVIPPSGRVVGQSGGATNGMHLDWTTTTGEDGERYLTFPFTIDSL